MTETSPRDTSVRGQIPTSVRIRVWAAAGGHCVICATNVIGAEVRWHTVLTGELAHNVGATDTPGSPRGRDDDIEDRQSPENLMLLCHDCHRLIDDVNLRHLFTKERLRARKADHEARVLAAAGSGGMRRAAVIRLGADVRGTPTIATGREVADTLLEEGFLGVVHSRWRDDFVVQIAGDTTRSSYWASGRDEINESVALLNQAVKVGDVENVAVFAIAPVPLLIYLGSRLDDKIPTRLYQKSRAADQGWRPDPTAPVHTFDVVGPAAATSAAGVVVTVSVTGPVDTARLPNDIIGLPRYDVRPASGAYGPEVLANPKSLRNFAGTVRSVLARVEAEHPAATTWHLVAAAPVTAAIELGRALMRDAQPPAHLYQRDDAGYLDVMTVNQ